MVGGAASDLAGASGLASATLFEPSSAAGDKAAGGCDGDVTVTTSSEAIGPG